MKATGNGSCLFNSAARGAWGGGGRRRPSETDELALPLRIHVIRAGVKRLKELDDNEPSFLRRQEAYDSDIQDATKKTKMTLIPVNSATGMHSADVSRALLVVGLKQLATEFAEGSIFCMPLIAEALDVNVRIYHPCKPCVFKVFRR